MRDPDVHDAALRSVRALQNMLSSGVVRCARGSQFMPLVPQRKGDGALLEHQVRRVLQAGLPRIHVPSETSPMRVSDVLAISLESVHTLQRVLPRGVVRGAWRPQPVSLVRQRERYEELLKHAVRPLLQAQHADHMHGARRRVPTMPQSSRSQL